MSPAPRGCGAAQSPPPQWEPLARSPRPRYPHSGPQGDAQGRLVRRPGRLSWSPQVNATAGRQSPSHLPGKWDLRTRMWGCWEEPRPSCSIPPHPPLEILRS